MENTARFHQSIWSVVSCENGWGNLNGNPNPRVWFSLFADKIDQELSLTVKNQQEAFLAISYKILFKNDNFNQSNII